eukprot:Mrub_06541.p3 GENE.Mrub_06541~~Mrub_06541.p3  ORF type:complete len:135 (+),score=39.49 Mrub_06541:499-903(+)
MKQQVEQMKKDLEEECKSKFVIASDLTRQYKAMLVDKETTINELNVKIEEVNYKLKQVQDKFDQEKKEEKAKLDKLHHQTQELEGEITAMSKNFAKILEDTLDEMRKKVSSANEYCKPSDQQLESAGDNIINEN